jgi:hypothetical protein
MQEKLESFLLQIPDFGQQSPPDLIDYFVYFLTVIEKRKYVRPTDVEDCFDSTRLKKYSNIPAYLSNNAKSLKKKKPKFIKTKDGYQLERNHQLNIQKHLHAGPAKVETSHLLRGLLSNLTDKKEQTFLQEVIDCYEIGARRAAIVMAWILAVYHLYKYIFKHELGAFNSALASRKDKSLKIRSIAKMDDFSEIPDKKFIEIARSAKVISNDVQKILDVKLGIRNSCGHPSGITVPEIKATDFIIDLADNVITKFSV